MIKIGLRPYHAPDVPFIINSWLKAYKHNSGFGKLLTYDVYFQHHERLIKSLLTRAKVTVATDEEDPDLILGYLVYERPVTQAPVLHFCFVKKEFRLFGIFSQLLRHENLELSKCIATHLTYPGERLREKNVGMVYNPYLAF